MTPREQPDTSQPSLRDILRPYHDHSCHSQQRWIKGMTQPFPCDCSIEKAEQDIRALIASAKPEKDNPELYDHHTPSYNQAIGYNQGIDAYEASLLRKLEREGQL